MPRFSMMVWVAMIISAAVGLYHVKYAVQDMQAEVAQLEWQIEQERESLHVVAAEWAYLSRPERVQQLSEKHLKLVPIAAQQFVTWESLPLHLPQAEDEALVPAAYEVTR